MKFEGSAETRQMYKTAHGVTGVRTVNFANVTVVQKTSIISNRKRRNT